MHGVRQTNGSVAEPVNVGKVGRPRVVLDTEQVKLLAMQGHTNVGIALAFGIARSTLEANFRSALEEGRNLLENSIRAKQVELALRGDSGMLKWLGIQLCGQRSQVGLSPNPEPDNVRRVIVNL